MTKRKTAPVKTVAAKKVLKKPAPQTRLTSTSISKFKSISKPKSISTFKSTSISKPTSKPQPASKPTSKFKPRSKSESEPALAKPSLKKAKPAIIKKMPQGQPQGSLARPKQGPTARSSQLTSKAFSTSKPQSSSQPKSRPPQPLKKSTRTASGVKKNLVLAQKLPKKADSIPAQQPMPSSKQASLAKPQGLSSKKTATPKAPSSPATGTASNPKAGAASTLKEKTKYLLLNARKRTATPTIFRTRQRKHTPILFTLEDVRNILQQKSSSTAPVPKPARVFPNLKPAIIAPKAPLIEKKLPAQFFQAASVADILGFNPKSAKAVTAYEQEASKIPQKYKPYYRLLVDLRTHLQQEINLHSQNALNRSGKDETTENSSYSQHMADAGTDTFDRDFALSILSNEQDALFEIDEAIQRMIQGTYGTCEITGKPIPKERLLAVPFTRCSIEGQKELERNKHRTQRSSSVGVFSEVFDDEHGFTEDENNET